MVKNEHLPSFKVCEGLTRFKKTELLRLRKHIGDFSDAKQYGPLAVASCSKPEC